MKLVPQKVSQSLGLMSLSAQKNSPTILFVGGLVGVVGGAVLACRATLKLEKTLEDVKTDIERVGSNNKPGNSLSKSEEDHNRQLTFAYANGAFSVIKLYSGAIVVGGLGIAALTHSHKTLTSRNASLTAAYTVVSEAFDAYRDRVREAVGEEQEMDIYLNRTIKKILDPESGEEIDVTVLNDRHGRPTSKYAKFFDEGSADFSKNPEQNLTFVRCQQEFANHKLHACGYLFLNDVYEALGIPKTSAGAIVGWKVGKGNQNHVDFGIYRLESRDFVNGYEPRILLDFNVDGVMFDLIED